MRAFKYVQGWVDAEGRVHQYFRRPGYPRIRLPGLAGSPEFLAAYQLAIGAPAAPVGAKRSKPGTVAAAIGAYLDSTLHFASRAEGTRTMHRSILNRFRTAYGDYPFNLMPTKFIAAVISKQTPHVARCWLKSIRALVRYAIEQNMIKIDPTIGIKLPSPKTGGIYTWTDDDIAAYEAKHPIGTEPRLALALMIHFAHRRSDVILVGRQNIKRGLLTYTQVKNRDRKPVTLTVPLDPELQTIIDATPGKHLTFLVDRRGKPYTPREFNRQFRKWCDQAGLPKACKPHGLRKAACRRLAEDDVSTKGIMSISGHRTLAEVQRYTDAAEQAKMARNVVGRKRAVGTKRN